MTIHKVTEQPYNWGYPQKPKVYRFTDPVEAIAKFEEIKQKYFDDKDIECWAVSEKVYDFASKLNGHALTYKIKISEVEFTPGIGE